MTYIFAASVIIAVLGMVREQVRISEEYAATRTYF